jgi:hypothetical protein
MALNKRSVVQAHSIPHTADTPPCNVYEYATVDAVATVVAPGYFNGLRDDGRIRVNDYINCYCVMGGVGDKVELKFDAVPSVGNVTTIVNGEAAGT